MWLFNIFADPLDPKSNTIWIYALRGLSFKLFVSDKTIATKIEELKLRWIDLEFNYIGNIPRPYNNLSAHAIAIAYPSLCSKYWKDKWKTVDEVIDNQSTLFEDIVQRIKKAKKIAK